MKQILFVLALVLILTVCSVGQAFALQYPYGDVRNGTTNEDHPWGGDGIGTEPPPVPVDPGKYGSSTSYSTITQPVDFVFRYFIMDIIDIFGERNRIPAKRTSIIQNEIRRTSTIKVEGIRK